jgi:2,4-didehydro-3-deoxy-L-rhamnonate hydrolase
LPHSPTPFRPLGSIACDTLPLARQHSFGDALSGLQKSYRGGPKIHVHVAESGMPMPSEPAIFMKATSCITGPNDAIMLAKDSKKTQQAAVRHYRVFGSERE